MTTAQKEKPRHNLGEGDGASEQRRNLSEVSAQNFSNSSPECKPPVLAPKLSTIPAALRQHAGRWAPWAAVWSTKRGKYDKIPRQAHDCARNASTKHSWWSFDEAVAGYGVLSLVEDGGVGFLMTGVQDLVGIDLDRCIDANGNIDDWAQEIVDKACSYAEVSPSGRGLRIFVKGAIAEDLIDHTRGIEVYGGASERFLTITGLKLDGCAHDVWAAPSGFLDWLETTYRIVKSRAAVALAADMPRLLPETSLPDLAVLPLPDSVRAFLADGELGAKADRSGVLAHVTLKLYEATAAGGTELDDSMVLSILQANPHAWEVAMDHRRQDEDAALDYLWRHHCLAVRGKASPPAAAFDVIAPQPGEPEPLPVFKRTNAGAILPSRENVVLALQRSDVCGYQLRHDVFRDEIMLATPGTDDWRAFRDPDYTELCITLERGGFKDIPKERIRDAVAYVAESKPFDSAGHWLGMQVWDGVPRVERFLIDYFGADDTPYTRAVGLYFWTALAGRVLQPGIKADMVPVAVGAQGSMKSSTVAAIVPAPDFFLELDLSSKDDDLARLMRGKLVIELGELKGLRAREQEHLKSFITRTHESWVPKFREMAVSYARRGVFFGTTNKDEFLADDTGHRRWLPFNAGTCDPSAAARDRDQLWAEARELFSTGGVQWHAAEQLARGEHDKFVVRDAWEEIVERWLDTDDELAGGKPADSPFTAVDALLHAVRMDGRSIGQAAKDRMARVLKELGYSQTRAYIDGKRVRAYVRGS